MKNVFVKLISVVIVLTIIIGSGLSITSNADGIKADTPIIYVQGQGAPLAVKHEDGTVTRKYPVEVPEGFVEETIKEAIGPFMKAFVTQDWTEVCDIVYDKISGLYAEIALDENGEITNDVECELDTSYDKIKSKCDELCSPGSYDVEAFEFFYDFRLSPIELAKQLRTYVENVLEYTGADKYAMIGRCEGACVVNAYLGMYDDDRITDVIFYSPANYGIEIVNASFTGNFSIDSLAAERYVYENTLLGGELDEIVRGLITTANDTYSLDIVTWAFINTYEQIYLGVLPKTMRSSFASFPGYWAMLSLENYETAKKVIFSDTEEGKYDKFIEKIDDYHDNYQMKFTEILKQYEDRGTDIFNISKYGFQLMPVTKTTDEVSDNTCLLSNSSYGATTSKITETFSDDYISKAKNNGTYKYISPDKLVDASTCLYKDRTWFIKNMEHYTFPLVVENLISAMINTDNFDVNSNPLFPQYLYYDGENISPLTENTTGIASEKWADVVERKIRVVKPYFKWIYDVVVFVIKTLTPKATY